MAGNLINMMSVSLREPYLFDLPIGASGSGYLFSRIYPNWDERRGGGSFSLGRQFGTSIYADVAARAEEVDFFGYQIAGPRRLPGRQRLHLVVLASSRASGSTTATARSWPPRASTCNSRPSKGLGSFTWTKFDAEGRMYIPTFSRPDGTGKQFFTLRGHFGIATDSTPGLRAVSSPVTSAASAGFQYRTVSPHAFGVPTGGVMMALGSVEYQFPWNARDTFHQIIFTDFGTVTRQLRAQRHADLGRDRAQGQPPHVRSHAV